MTADMQDKASVTVKPLERIIERSHNGELGTSKVIDMRRLAEDALKDKEVAG